MIAHRLSVAMPSALSTLSAPSGSGHATASGPGRNIAHKLLVFTRPARGGGTGKLGSAWEPGTPSRGNALSLREGARPALPRIPRRSAPSRQARRSQEEVVRAPRSVLRTGTGRGAPVTDEPGLSPMTWPLPNRGGSGCVGDGTLYSQMDSGYVRQATHS